MKRTCTAAAAALASLALASGPASAAQGTSNARAARGATVQLRHTGLGTILVNAGGFTLYRFSLDSRNKDACAKVSECLRNWPALRTSGRPTAGRGLKASLLSSIPLPGGGRQVTYAGHPLYLYAAQSERGETSYVGAEQFGGIWDAVSPSGGLVR